MPCEKDYAIETMLGTVISGYRSGKEVSIFAGCIYRVLFHIISYHIISYHIISYHIISYHIISYHIISYDIISYHNIAYFLMFILLS